MKQAIIPSAATGVIGEHKEEVRSELPITGMTCAPCTEMVVFGAFKSLQNFLLMRR